MLAAISYFRADVGDVFLICCAGGYKGPFNPRLLMFKLIGIYFGSFGLSMLKLTWFWRRLLFWNFRLGERISDKV